MYQMKHTLELQKKYIKKDENVEFNRKKNISVTLHVHINSIELGSMLTSPIMWPIILAMLNTSVYQSHQNHPAGAS